CPRRPLSIVFVITLDRGVSARTCIRPEPAPGDRKRKLFHELAISFGFSTSFLIQFLVRQPFAASLVARWAIEPLLVCSVCTFNALIDKVTVPKPKITLRNFGFLDHIIILVHRMKFEFTMCEDVDELVAALR